MEEEVISAVKTVIIMLVILGVVLTIALVVMQSFGSLKSEAGNATASGIIVAVSTPDIGDCKLGDWTLTFGPVNVTDPERRSFDVVPIISFAGGKSYGAGKYEPNTGQANWTFGAKQYSLIPVSKGKGSVSQLKFQGSYSFPTSAASGAIANLDTADTLNVRLGLWIWTGKDGCVYKALTDNWPGSNFVDVLTYTSKNCAATYIAVIEKSITNTCK